MNPKVKLFLVLVLIFGVISTVIIAGIILSPALLNPQGAIARHQRDVALLSSSIMLVVAIPMLIAAGVIVWKYRDGNSKSARSTEVTNNKLMQVVMWTIPSIVVAILAFINWNSTHALDPYKEIESSKKPITIEVVALQWKWLFIYPEYNIASVNFVQFPEDTPINFVLSADAPMSSFWIPQLGGQMYAMTGMGTKLQLIADNTGDFPGSAAEINGEGFSGMRFVARASSEKAFYEWIDQVRQSEKTLTKEEYSELAKPTEHHPVMSYSSADPDLFNSIMAKYMMPHVNNSEGGHH